MKKRDIVRKTVDQDIIDKDFCQYDSLSVSPEHYDPNVPVIIHGDPIVKSLSSPTSVVLPDDYLSES